MDFSQGQKWYFLGVDVRVWDQGPSCTSSFVEAPPGNRRIKLGHFACGPGLEELVQEADANFCICKNGLFRGQK